MFYFFVITSARRLLYQLSRTIKVSIEINLPKLKLDNQAVGMVFYINLKAFRN